MKNKLGLILKKIIFAFGAIYSINLILSNVGICLPINLATIGITAFLGSPGLLSLFTILYIVH